jgi:hypothetical protein
MKKILTAIFISVSLLTATAQDNPYQMFGTTVKASYNIKREDLLRVKNPDTTSAQKVLAFDFIKKIVYILDINDAIIKSASIDDERLLRWLSVDPMTRERVSLSPYNFVSNNPIKRIDPNGALDDDYTAKKDGTIEVKKTDDKFDRFFVEKKDGTTSLLAQLDKHTTSNGTTLVNFPDAGEGFTRYGDKDPGGDHFVKPEIAAALFGAVNEFSEKNPDVKVQFGDMSNSNGERPNETHTTHKGGRNVDFRYIRTDGELKPVNINSPQLDKIKSQDLINAFNKFGFNGSKSIGSFPNSEGVLFNNTFKLKGHDTHGHLQNFKANK